MVPSSKHLLYISWNVEILSSWNVYFNKLFSENSRYLDKTQSCLVEYFYVLLIEENIKMAHSFSNWISSFVQKIWWLYYKMDSSQKVTYKRIKNDYIEVLKK